MHMDDEAQNLLQNPQEPSNKNIPNLSIMKGKKQKINKKQGKSCWEIFCLIAQIVTIVLLLAFVVKFGEVIYEAKQDMQIVSTGGTDLQKEPIQANFIAPDSTNNNELDLDELHQLVNDVPLEDEDQELLNFLMNSDEAEDEQQQQQEQQDKIQAEHQKLDQNEDQDTTDQELDQQIQEFGGIDENEINWDD